MDLPTAQLRTSRNKKFVYVDGSVIKKGPYKASDRALELAERNLSVLQLLQRLCDIPPHLRTDLPFVREVSPETGDIYLVYENVGLPPKKGDANVTTTKIDQEVLVLGRRTFVDRVSDREKTDELAREQAEAALQHLYFRYLMNVGDSGTHNILVRHQSSVEGQLVVGIDMEENRSGTPTGGVLGLLFKRPSKLQVEKYTPLVKTIKQLPVFNDEARETIADLGVEPNALWERALEFRRCSTK